MKFIFLAIRSFDSDEPAIDIDLQNEKSFKLAVFFQNVSFVRLMIQDHCLGSSADSHHAGQHESVFGSVAIERFSDGSFCMIL